MFTDESAWIRDEIAKLALPHGADVIDIGSSTRQLREVIQPHIHGNLFAPLLKRGMNICYLDAKSGDGIDICCDITQPETAFIQACTGRTFDLAICSSMLEHVRDIDRTLNNISLLLKKGGYLVLTVPERYRHHGDPIDTMYRPDPATLVQRVTTTLPDLRLITSASVRVDDRRYYRRLRLLRFLIPSLRWRQCCAIFKKH